MTTMLVPAVHSYFAIYTLEQMRQSAKRRGLSWDLHATATDRTMAISHARMLALQPGVSEVQVKQVTEDTQSGLVSVRDIKRCKRGRFDIMKYSALTLLALAVIAGLSILAIKIFA